MMERGPIQWEVLIAAAATAATRRSGTAKRAPAAPAPATTAAASASARAGWGGDLGKHDGDVPSLAAGFASETIFGDSRRHRCRRHHDHPGRLRRPAMTLAAFSVAAEPLVVRNGQALAAFADPDVVVDAAELFFDALSFDQLCVVGGFAQSSHRLAAPRTFTRTIPRPSPPADDAANQDDDHTPNRKPDLQRLDLARRRFDLSGAAAGDECRVFLELRLDRVNAGADRPRVILVLEKWNDRFATDRSCGGVGDDALGAGAGVDPA